LVAAVHGGGRQALTAGEEDEAGGRLVPPVRVQAVQLAVLFDGEGLGLHHDRPVAAVDDEVSAGLVPLLLQHHPNAGLCTGAVDREVVK
jgi:hypothetical protein